MTIIAIAWLIVKGYLAVALLALCMGTIALIGRGLVALCATLARPTERHTTERRVPAPKPNIGLCIAWGFVLTPIFCALVIYFHGSN